MDILFLVATNETQGDRDSDFCWTNEGEPVHFGSECDGEPIDGSCGCRRAMSGLVSCRATTTMKLAYLDKEDLYNRLQTFFYENWAHEDMPESQRIAGHTIDFVQGQIIFLQWQGASVGSIVERRGSRLYVRGATVGFTKVFESGYEIPDDLYEGIEVAYERMLEYIKDHPNTQSNIPYALDYMRDIANIEYQIQPEAGDRQLEENLLVEYLSNAINNMIAWKGEEANKAKKLFRDFCEKYWKQYHKDLKWDDLLKAI